MHRQILPDLPGTWRYFKRLLITNHQVFNSDDTATLFPRLLSRHYRFSQTQIYTHVLKKEEKSHLISHSTKIEKWNALVSMRSISAEQKLWARIQHRFWLIYSYKRLPSYLNNEGKYSYSVTKRHLTWLWALCCSFEGRSILWMSVHEKANSRCHFHRTRVSH